jgi:hypothetical protein
MDQLIHEYFVRCGFLNLLPKKSSRTAITAENRIKRILRSLFWHFLQAKEVHDDCYVRISLREVSYRKSATENPHRITDQISEIIAILSDRGVIDRCKGFLNRDTMMCKQTRIRPRLTLLEDLKTLPRDIAENYVAPPPVRIRDELPENLDGASAAHMAGMESTLSHYNEFMRSHTVTLPDAPTGSLIYRDKNSTQRCVTTKRKNLSAIYHVDEPNKLSYGRIHGASWQCIPSEYRKTLLIDGEPTVELDYKAQIVHLVASLDGIQLEGDPYAFPLILPNADSSIARKVAKYAIMIMLSCAKRKSFFGALKNRLTDEGVWKKGMSLVSIERSIFAKHPFLEKHAYQGNGKHLFMRDAAIARGIIQIFLDHGKIVLPIHDGFVVKKTDQALLYDAMDKVWFDAFGTAIPIEVEN